MKKQNHSKWHGLYQIICYATVFIGIFYIFKKFIKFDGPSQTGGSWWYLLFLLCPLMHLIMMRGGHGSCHGNDKTHNQEQGDDIGKGND